MRAKEPLGATLCLLLGLAAATAAEPPSLLAPREKPQWADSLLQVQDKLPLKEKPPEKKPEEKKSPDPAPRDAAPANDAFAQAPPSGGGEAPGSAVNTHMIGDFPGLFARQTVFVPTIQTINTFQTRVQTLTQFTTVTLPQQVTTQTTFTTVTIPQIDRTPLVVQVPTTITTTSQPTVVQVPTTVTNTTQVPLVLTQHGLVKTTVAVALPGRGAFKIGENESAEPQDRVFFTYNYYSDVRGPDNGAGFPRVETQTTTFNGNPATVTTVIPGVAASANIHREVFGGEKTFLGGDASVGLRAPLLQTQGDGAFDSVGDLTAILKYAFYRDAVTGNVLSGGLAVTLPTGQAFQTFAGDIHSTVLQPFAGFRWSEDRFFVQGFTSVAVPTDARDVTLLFNDVGVGYRVYRGAAEQFISSVSPTVEAHLTTPLNNRGETNPIFAPDQLVLTAGAYVGLFNRSTLTLAVATPVTGPRTFDVEAIVQFNWRF